LNQHDGVAATVPAPEVTMDDDDGSVPVACTLGPGDMGRRAARWQALARHSLLHAARTDRGLRLVFRAGPEAAGELRELVALERDCCAFAVWSLDESGSEFTLDVTGDGDQAVGAVQSLFPALG
jgi:hypothetical protein